MNPYVTHFTRQKKGNVTDQLVTSTDPAGKKVERLFLSMLQRKPTAKEAAAFARHLGDKTTPAAAEDAVWVLLNSSEFRFNH